MHPIKAIQHFVLVECNLPTRENTVEEYSRSSKAVAVSVRNRVNSFLIKYSQYVVVSYLL